MTAPFFINQPLINIAKIFFFIFFLLLLQNKVKFKQEMKKQKYKAKKLTSTLKSGVEVVV
jgi:hypothetical protein